MGITLNHLRHSFQFPSPSEPAWAKSVSRWHQMDAASFGLTDAYLHFKNEMGVPSLILLASPLASNESDFNFVAGGAMNPTKMIHTLPNVRVHSLLNLMEWSGPVLCIQKDPETIRAGLEEALSFVGEKFPVVWVVSVSGDTSGHVVDFFVLSSEQASVQKGSALSFPVATKSLGAYVPHRFPMLWIHEVLWVTQDQGACLVHPQELKHAWDEKGVRASSAVEWMAQASGFIKTCQYLNFGQQQIKETKNAYLVSVRNVELIEDFSKKATSQNRLIVTVQTIRDLEPFSIIRAQVKTEAGEILALGELKVFIE